MMNILLIHGQGRTPLAMTILGWRLRRHQHRVHYFGYVCAWQSFNTITRRFVRYVRARMAGEPYLIVAHSLGGIFARAGLPELTETPPRHLVMLAPPNQPARIAKKMRTTKLYRWLTGDCGRKLADDDFYKSLPLPNVPTTVIAGTRGLPEGVPPFGDEANDSVLAVEETRLSPDGEVIRVPAMHPLIMNSKEVAWLVLEIAKGT